MANATHTHPTYGPCDIREIDARGTALIRYIGSASGAACAWHETPIPRQATVPVAELAAI